jgi:hypothetical protein
MGDDEDELQGRIGRGEARLKGDVEDWTGPQARSYAVGVVLHRPHLHICHVHGRLLLCTLTPEMVSERGHLPQNHASPVCVCVCVCVLINGGPGPSSMGQYRYDLVT